jgi:hypothetical protein
LTLLYYEHKFKKSRTSLKSLTSPEIMDNNFMRNQDNQKSTFSTDSLSALKYNKL